MRRGAGIFRRAVFEEIGVLDPVQHFLKPGQVVTVDVIHRLQSQLVQPPVGNKADILFDLIAGKPFNRAQFEGEVDEGVLMPDDGVAGAVELAAHLVGPDMRVFFDEGVEQLDD